MPHRRTKPMAQPCDQCGTETRQGRVIKGGEYLCPECYARFRGNKGDSVPNAPNIPSGGGRRKRGDMIPTDRDKIEQMRKIREERHKREIAEQEHVTENVRNNYRKQVEEANKRARGSK